MRAACLLVGPELRREHVHIRLERALTAVGGQGDERCRLLLLRLPCHWWRRLRLRLHWQRGRRRLHLRDALGALLHLLALLLGRLVATASTAAAVLLLRNQLRHRSLRLCLRRLRRHALQAAALAAESAEHQGQARLVAGERLELDERVLHRLNAHARREQRADDLGLVVPARGHERAALEELLGVVHSDRLRVGVGAERKEQPNRLDVTHHAGHYECGAASEVCGLDVCSRACEEYRALVVRSLACEHERRDPFGRADVDGGRCAQEQLDALGLALAARPVERRKSGLCHLLGHSGALGALRGNRVDVGLGCEEQLQDAPLA